MTPLTFTAISARVAVPPEVCELTRPMNSSMIFGGWPAAGMTVGFATKVAIANQ